MGRTSFDFDVISGPAPSRAPASPPAPAKPVAGSDGAGPPSDVPAPAK
jgi:hypothetical protein